MCALFVVFFSVVLSFVVVCSLVFFFKQKTAYEMRISDWSSDVCSSDLSGLLVVAKTDPAHEGLAAQFARHSIERRYLAIVAGVPVPPAGKVDAPLARSPHDRKKMAVSSSQRAKRAVTHYRLIERLKGAAMVECRLETEIGRAHV